VTDSSIVTATLSRVALILTVYVPA